MNHWFPGQVCVSLRSSHSALAVGWRTHCGFGAGGVVFCGTLRMENWNEMGFWLVVWNISYFPINIGLLIIPIDEVIFFRGGQTTNLCLDGSSHSSTKKSPATSDEVKSMSWVTDGMGRDERWSFLSRVHSWGLPKGTSWAMQPAWMVRRTWWSERGNHQDRGPGRKRWGIWAAKKPQTWCIDQENAKQIKIQQE